MVKRKLERETLTKEVKEVATESGANLVGTVSAEVYDSLPKVWVEWKIQDYSKKAAEIMPEAKSVIVVGYHVWDDMLEMAIKKGEEWFYPGYFPLEAITQKVKGYLEKKGF